jgi:transcriptional regulator of acetoin/glycerol metabolism
MRLSTQALQLLKAFSWPGNVRQLEQGILAAAAVCEGNEIEPEDFPVWLRDALESQDPPSQEPPDHRSSDDRDLPRETPYLLQEKETYIKALEQTKYSGTGRWNYAAAARILGIPRKTFTRRLRKLKIISP